jgi:hypothetical protein
MPETAIDGVKDDDQDGCPQYRGREGNQDQICQIEEKEQGPIEEDDGDPRCILTPLGEYFSMSLLGHPGLLCV